MKKFFSSALFLFSALVFVFGCATVPPRPPCPAEQVYLNDLCDEHGVDWQWDSVAQTVLLRFGQNEARALLDSDVVLLDGREVVLSAPLIREKESIVVPPDFKKKIIDRLCAVEITQPAVNILIDPGHGGRDPGAISHTGFHEKTVTLDIARRLKNSLRQRGFETMMTRADDRFISLEERTQIAAAGKADLFVSIHANSCPSRGVDGIEVYYLRPLSCQEKKEAQREKNRGILFSALNMDQDDENLKTIVADMLEDNKEEVSRILADHVARGLSRVMRTTNRGARESAFFVLRNALMPAVLIEVGFLSNAREEKLLKTADYRQKIADTIAESLYSYTRIQGI